ncbi:MAG: hypothetical protein CL849_00700 [Crocinitomicaceae bacterium]|nr:hypothetical protein [Crocinitomicaceae bacterium]
MTKCCSRSAVMVLLLTSCLRFFGQPADWNVVPSSFEFSMTVTFTISIDGLVGAHDENVAGVFDSNGACRGLGVTNFSAATGYFTGIMMIYSNETSELGLNIKIWDAELDSLPTCSDQIDFLVNSIQGSLLNPTVFYGVYDPLVGCTDPEACNYLITAITDNGSCIYPGCNNPDACNYVEASPCVDNSSCIFPQPFLDCDENCLSDFDGDGICDEFEIGGCTDSLACNYSSEATDEDCSCIFPIYPIDCNGNCYIDTDGDGVCDGDEVYGCDNINACNFSPDATEDDGSCELCCYTILNVDNGYSVDIEIWSPQGSEFDLLSTQVTYRLYLITNHPQDRVIAVEGSNGFTTAIGSNDGFYQSIDGALSIAGIDSAQFIQDELVRRDSWLTIGAEFPWELNPGELTINSGVWSDLFEAGGTIFLGGSTGNGWSIDEGNPLAIAGSDQRILLAQLTSSSPIEGQLNCTVIPHGEVDPIQITPFFIPPPCGCTDIFACNYNPLAVVDDGSCINPEIGEDCVGQCIADADLDGICDGDEVVGCTDINADNFDPNATDSGFCIYFGCVYPDALNFDFNANFDNGACDFLFVSSCPTDINGDGITAASDILEILATYGTPCE